MQQIAAPQSSLDIIKTAQDSLVLPLRRPILFVPFLFALAMLVVMVGVVVFGTLITWWQGGQVGPQHIVALCGAAALSILTSILALEMIIDLTARAELGMELDLSAAIAHAVSRFPATLATTAVMTAAISVGLVLLLIPGLVLMIRWFLAPNAVLLSGRGVRGALALSWELTGAHFAPLFGLTLVVGVVTAVISIPLNFIPVVGQLAAGWLGFAWGGMALALAYVRLGAPTHLD